MSMFYDDDELHREPVPAPGPHTISDVLGIGPVLILLLLATLVLAIVALDEPRPALVIRDEVPVARHYCIEPSTHLIVTDRGKHIGGGSC